MRCQALEQRYPIGTRVQVTERGLYVLCMTYPNKTGGVVVGYDRYGRRIKVRRDGNRCAANYSPDLWEPEGGAA